MNREEIERNLQRLGAHLAQQGLEGAVVLFGGAVMVLEVGNRDATKDIDAYFQQEAAAIRAAAHEVAQEVGLLPDWLNDAVKGFIAVLPPTKPWKEFPGLKVATVTLDYLFAMKVASARPQDIEDLQALQQVLAIPTLQAATELVLRYVPERLLTPRARYVLEMLLSEEDEEGAPDD
jgi:predicted nucleotidyltransferase